MTTIHASASSDTADRYLDAWNDTEPQSRRAKIDAAWAEDGGFTDPVASAHGRDDIDATIASVQSQFPGWVFSPVGDVDAHHDQARFQWSLDPAGQQPPPIIGFDVAVGAPSGQLRCVLGFLDRVPTS